MKVISSGHRMVTQSCKARTNTVPSASMNSGREVAMIQRFDLTKLTKEFDLIVIGGGINGCGIARDAAERGLRVLLLEKNDFGSGCTDASTHLIHGGLRYLEHGELNLVYESLHERELLLKLADYLIKPFEFCLPIYNDQKRNFLTILAGMLLYDVLSIGKSMPMHKMHFKQKTLELEPSLNPVGLVGSAFFYDAQIAYPERLCVDNVLMASKSQKSLILNHAEVVGFDFEEDRISSVAFIDDLTGKTHKAKGKLVVNASGPWVDSLLQLTHRNLSRKMGGTKGSHIVIKKFDGGPERGLLLAAKSDQRPFFINPWQEQYYMIGTTDIFFDGDLDKVQMSTEEEQYLLQEANAYLSGKTLTHDDIVFSYAGVRPLPFVRKTDPGSITRRHIICDHSQEGIGNLLSVIGGKLTTYRHLAEEVVTLAYKKLGYELVETKTKIKPLLGAIGEDVDVFKDEQAKRHSEKCQLDKDIIDHLIDLYGSRYKKILDLIYEDKDLARLLSSNALDIRAQVLFSFTELAYTISDVIRRMSLGVNQGLGEDAIEEIASRIKDKYGLTSEEIKNQIRDYYENIVELRKS